eukprot:1192349-Pyramimonas_sp.AAC.1
MGQPIKHHWRIIVINVVQRPALRSHARCPVECWGADRQGQGPRGLAPAQQGGHKSSHPETSGSHDEVAAAKLEVAPDITP